GTATVRDTNGFLLNRTHLPRCQIHVLTHGLVVSVRVVHDFMLEFGVKFTQDLTREPEVEARFFRSRRLFSGGDATMSRTYQPFFQIALQRLAALFALLSRGLVR